MERQMSRSDSYAKNYIFLYYGFLSKPLLKISTFVNHCTKKCVEPKTSLIDQKMENKCIKVTVM